MIDHFIITGVIPTARENGADRSVQRDVSSRPEGVKKKKKKKNHRYPNDDRLSKKYILRDTTGAAEN